MIITLANNKKVEVNDGDTIKFNQPVTVNGKPQDTFKVIYAGRKPTFILGKRSVKVDDWRERGLTVVTEEHTNAEVEKRLKVFLAKPSADNYKTLNTSLLLHLAQTQVGG